ncbi:hypothetical protein [Desulfogranum marinum]|uniref:hypothetical protein n=1 Tax=Desulfogranum marinum TaxID=453220 RepID=UPI0029C7A110|nr:hypothetical protein [Desulfogranum marinum]
MKTEQNQVTTESEKSAVNAELERDITSDDLQKVFRWSPTQIKKIDQFLKRRLSSVWPDRKLKNDEFYQELLAVVTDFDEGYRLERIMVKLDDQQPKKKTAIFHLWKRFLLQLKWMAQQVDREKANEIAEQEEPQNPVKDLIELLSENDKPEYELVYDHFMSALFEENDEDENEACCADEGKRNLPWSSLNEEVEGITRDLGKIVQKLALGLCEDDEQAINYIRILKDKGAALKNTILESAERVGFTEDPWGDLESFETYCTNLGNILAEQESESSKLIQFYGKLIDFVETLEVVHRLPRKQTKFNESLKAIIEEFSEQIDNDCPKNFPHARQPRDWVELEFDLEGAEVEAREWFEWAFNLEGAELEALLDELDESFPELAEFLAECQWDWLRFKEEDKLEEGKEEAEPVVSELEEIDGPEVVEPEPLLSSKAELDEDALLDDNNEPVELEDEQFGDVEPFSEGVSVVEGQKNIEHVPSTSHNNKPDVYDENGTGHEAQSPELEEKETFCEGTSLPEEEFVAKCIANNEIAKAYWVVRSCKMDLSADLIGAYALGSQIGIGSAIPGELQSLYGKLVTEDFSFLHSKLFLLGAIAGVALFADPPSGEVSTLISFVDTGVKHLDNLVNLIKSDFLYQGAVRSEDLNVVLSKEDKEHEVIRLREMSLELLNRIRSSSSSYEPATILLRQLYQEGAELTELHRAVEKNDESKISFVRQIIKNTTGEQIVSEAHKLGIKKITKPITGSPRNQVIRRLNETLSLGREWLNLSSYRKQERDQTLQEKKLIQLKRTLKKVVDDLGDVGHDGLEKTAAKALKNCFTQLLRNLNGERCRKIEPLSSELIAELQIELDDDFEIIGNSKNCLLQNFSTEKTLELSEENIKVLFDRNEFVRAKAIIDSHEELTGANDFLHDKVDRLKASLNADIKALNDMVEDAYLLGQLAVLEEHDSDERPVSLRSELTGKLNKIEKQLDHTDIAISWRIRDILPKVESIKSELSEINSKSQAKVREEFTAIIKKLPDTETGREDKEYIEKAFGEANSQRDNIAAFELLNRVKMAINDGMPIPRASMGANDDFDQFIKQLPTYQDLLGNKSRIRSYIASIKSRKNIGKIPIKYAELDKAHLEQVVSGLSAWNELLMLNFNQSNKHVSNGVATIASYVGLKVKASAIKEKTPLADDFTWLQVPLEFPIDSSPVPVFGSAMGTSANIVVSKNKMEVDQLYSFLTRNRLQHQPVFLFYLNEMGPKQRQKYQRLFFKRKISVLIVDLCLAFFLSGIKNRLPSLFNTTLPFCFVQPYMMKGANVPSEIFVGRDKEVESIKNPDGSCIIYGGRQLGKSALLRHFCNTFHDPNEETYVAYVEIDSLGLEPQTHEQMMEMFWRKVYRNLCRIGFLQERTIRAKKSQTVEDEIVDEINKALHDLPGERSLYLLLDETDNFLDNDSSRNFPIIRRLRGMVASNNRQFKVVLAGLQSVQRYKNWKNHPFAQLGADIVINPLSASAAQRLILSPLSAIGFTFEKTGLILRILSQANYHPGLIQIFCHRLVENLYKKWGNVMSSPDQAKRLIRSEDLQAIERNSSFKEEIKERFDWTLDLDDRYKVLTYGIVLEEDQAASRTEREFMQIAQSWWPQVFKAMDQQALRAVLDEMVGLGVLVREDESSVRTYRLRSPNLLRLLGTRVQIEDELMRITSLDKPRVLNSRNFHPNNPATPLTFSPLTTEQEGQIASGNIPFSMTVISGSAALGLDSVRDRIKVIFSEEIEDEDWSELIPPADASVIPEKLIHFVTKKLKPRKRDHHYLVVDLSLLAHDLPLSSFFKEVLAECQRQVCTKDSRGHLVFLMDPNCLWNWLDDPGRDELLANSSFNYISLKRWSDGAITNALDNVEELAGGKTNGEKVFAMNSGWHRHIKGGLDRLSKRNGKKVNTLQLWEEQKVEFANQLVSSPQLLLEQFGLNTGDQLRDDMLTTLFAWSDTGEHLKISSDSLETWRDDVGEDSELAKNERRLKEWLKGLDIAYLPHHSKDQEGLMIEGLAGKVIKTFLLAEK